MRRSVAFELVQAHAFGSVVTDLLDSQIAAIKIDSAFGPPIAIADPFKATPSEEPGVASWGAKMLKPKITVEMRGADPIVIAPYGEPGESAWNVVLAVGAVLGLLALYGGATLVTKG